ncbi:shikimate kinase [Leptobacterium sp. I13]|uniref:shikimate kinase n=1 Tax=Leptobacterium meishanense TaxID=3128904 RepID=UPI0030EEB119
MIVLIGYMGSGKTVIGKLLSEKFQLPFIDLDDYITSNEGMSISQLFKEKGEIYFRKQEYGALKKILASEANVILSVGGGTPCYGKNMEMILDKTKNVFYLKASVDTLVNRLTHEKEERPLIKNIKTNELAEFITKHLFERGFFYLQAHHIINVDDVSTKKVVEAIRRLL